MLDRRAIVALLSIVSAPAFAATHPAQMTRYTVRTDPDEWQVRCNDGTVPIFYFRAGRGDHVDDWIIHLEGGSSCQDPADCLGRAAGDSPELMGTGCVMDSAGVVTCGTTAGIVGAYSGLHGTGWYNNEIGPTRSYDGVHSDYADNPFHDWNKVEVRYCSSDTWAGQGALGPMDAGPGQDLYSQFAYLPASGGAAVDLAPGGVLPSAYAAWSSGALGLWDNVWIGAHLDATGLWNPGTGVYGTLDFTPDTWIFDGRYIVERLIEQLLDGDFDADGSADGGKPRLVEASTVVFSGSSAGGVGARTNFDAVGDQLHAAQAGAGEPSAYFAGLFEGSFSGGDDPLTDASSAPVLSSGVTGNRGLGVARQLYWGAFVDESCALDLGVPFVDEVTVHEARAECYAQAGLVEGDYLDHPFAARHALWDGITRPDYGGSAAANQLEKRQQQQMIEYGGWHSNESGSQRGFYYPCSTTHVLFTSAAFYNQGLEAGGAGESMASMLMRWGAGDELRLAATGCSP